MVVNVTKEGGIATVTLNRPEALNSFNQEMLVALPQLWQDLDADDEVRVVVLTGAGRAFCAGADIKETAQRLRSGETTEPPPRPGVLDLFPTNLSKPLIAAVNGPAAGGGLGLVLSSDIAIAAPEAIFVVPFVARGTLDPHVVSLLVKKVPPVWAAWMCLSADRVDAETALRIGLVKEVVPREELLPRAQAMAEKITQGAWLSVLAMKQKLRLALETTYREASSTVGSFEEALRQSGISVEGFGAAADKRRARFEE